MHKTTCTAIGLYRNSIIIQRACNDSYYSRRWVLQHELKASVVNHRIGGPNWL